MVTLTQLLGPASAIQASQVRQKQTGGGSGSSQTHAGDEEDDDDGDGDGDYHDRLSYE